MTLRRRILLGLMVLVGVGLVVTDGALWFGLHTYLYGQVDSQLSSFANSRAAGDACSGASFLGHGGSPAPGLPATSYAEFIGADGTIVCSGFLDPQAASDTSPPHVPLAYGTSQGDSPLGRPFDVTSVSGTTGYRMLAVSGLATFDFGTDQEQGTLVVAMPTTDAGSTLDRLRLIELVTSVAVLVVLLAGAWSILRVGLRPLEDMTDTAGAIAAGDLSRRVPTGDPRSEVGQLGAALNTMLSQIETAFAARERSESRLRRFVADASHELRTPLTSIRGYAELFRRGAARRPEDLATAMRRIEEESTRMGVLVDDLLQLARLDLAAAERRQPIRGPVDLAAIAVDAAADLGAVEPGRPVVVEAAPADLTGDEDALRQVVANLVANARHHTPGDAAVAIRTGTSPDGRAVFLEVADEGPGMSEDDAVHVFERFWRADPARTRGHGGAGLGLSIVAAIVDAHRGTVGVQSVEGAGSRFRVELPASLPETATAVPDPAVAPLPAPGEAAATPPDGAAAAAEEAAPPADGTGRNGTAPEGSAVSVS